MVNKEKLSINIRFHDILLICSMLYYILTRILFMNVYNFQYTDEDQVVMWLGTVSFSHGHIIEPMWLGQNYGSMLESLVAVPLYLCNISLNTALPISAFLVSFLPILLIVFLCCKERKFVQAWGILSVLLLLSIDMDVLMSIPRSFIPGYGITIGGILLCIKTNNKYLKTLGGIFFTVGVAMSETAICIVLPILLYYVWNYKKLEKKIWFFIGCLIGGIYPIYCYLFYKVHADYVIYLRPRLLFDIKLFLSRVHEFTVYFKNLVVFQNAWIFVLLMLLLYLLFHITGNIGSSLIIISTLGGLFLTLGFSKISQHDSVLWSASRQFLFVPYNIILALYLSDLSKQQERIKHLWRQKTVKQVFSMIVFIMITLSFLNKYVDYKNREQVFKQSTLNKVISVDKLQNIARNEYMLMMENGYQFAVIGDAMEAHAVEALYDEKVTTWGMFFDRNNYVYEREKHKIRPEVLLITHENDSITADIKETGNRCVIQYLYDEYGIKRTPIYSSWDG